MDETQEKEYSYNGIAFSHYRKIRLKKASGKPEVIIGYTTKLLVVKIMITCHGYQHYESERRPELGKCY
jgi:hypothetical protein